jgi:beta-phosphoglucomutase-like phosphatase (HAD superfamily)
VIEAVVFDLDGVIVDSERVWSEVRERYTRETGGTYGATATRDMMGMSAPEWSRYMSETLGVPGTPEEIDTAVVERMLVRYGAEPPLVPGAVEAVRRIGERWPLAIASSSNPELIEVVLRVSGRRSREASRRPTCTSRRRGDWMSTHAAVPRSRTRRTASARRTRQG